MVLIVIITIVLLLDFILEKHGDLLKYYKYYNLIKKISVI